MSLHIVIMAAGKGQRMKSQRPKVLHSLAGEPLARHVLRTAQALQPAHIIFVVGHGALEVKAHFAHDRVSFALQDPPRGTGDAVKQAAPQLPDEGVVLVLNGDVPLVPPEALPGLLAEAAQGRLAILTADTPDAGSYGRIVREPDGNVVQIVEAKDATPAQRALTEWYTGTLAAPAGALKRWLSMLKPNNVQKEYYLTDIVECARAENTTIVAVKAAEAWRVEGVNDRAQLAALERQYQASLAQALMQTGVALTDPARIDIRGTLTCAADVSIDIGCVFEGDVILGENVSIGPYCVIRNAHIGAETRIEAYSHIDGATTGHGARIGPYARLRPGAELDADVHIGNFVEIKASRIGKGSKANHLSYIGDAEVGSDCNIGAGTITCNYDGANKHKTTIGNNVHIGSDVQLVAPVTLANGVTVGAGTTVWKDVTASDLVVNPKQQLSKPGWQRPQKKPKA